MEVNVKTKDLGIIAIGEPFDLDVQTFPEGCHFNYDSSGYWLHYLYQNPTKVEIDSIQKGEADFGLYVRGPILFLLHRFGQMNWNDAAYSWWLVSEEFRKIPEEGEGFHALLKVVLVDTNTGIVKALRALTFSAEFTDYLHATIRKQIKEPWSKDRHEQAVRHIYSRYSTIDLVERGEVFCRGGE
jgi:hypothetical protein